MVDQLAGRLLIQCRPKQAMKAAEVAKAHGAGLVLTGDKPETTVRSLQDRGFSGPILCDAGRYSGRRRIRAGRGIRPAWCRRQHDLGLPALTDSGYLCNQDWPGLRSILHGASNQAPTTIAVLPLAAAWFRAPPVYQALVNVINSFGVPVAIAIEHRKDPFGAQYVIRGFLHLLTGARVPVLLLRSDFSAIGALCHGAHAAAIGTSSGLRHFYPETQGGPENQPGISIFVTPLLSYHRLEVCAEVFSSTPDIAQLWACECPACEGITPDRTDSGTAAFEHSLHAQLALHAELFSRLDTRQERTSSWHEACGHAEFIHNQVAETIEDWRTPASIRSWQAVTEDPLPRGERIPRQPTAERAQASRERLSPPQPERG